MDVTKRREYLTPAQVEVVRAKMLEMKSFEDQMETFHVIDAFIMANGTSDKAYENLREVVTRLFCVYQDVESYPEIVIATLVPLLSISVFDLGYLTSVITEDDLDQMSREVSKKFGGASGPDTSHLA